MQTKKVLYAGQPGTHKWIKKYGKDLLAVRYKYDDASNEKMVTVELIADTQKWEKNRKRIPSNKIMKIKINYGEIELGRRVKTLGGKWNKQQKVWEISFGMVEQLNLKDRIVDDR